MLTLNITVALPEVIDDEYLKEDGIGNQPVGCFSIQHAFVVTINVFNILEGALKLKHGPFSHVISLPELTEVLQLNEKINQIEAKLPPQLRWDDHAKMDTPRDLVLKLQSEAISTRYGMNTLFYLKAFKFASNTNGVSLPRLHHLRLVLLRPNVLTSARQSLLPSYPSLPLSRTETILHTELSTTCVEAAVSAIFMLYANLNSASRIFSSNAVFVTLSAATVIVAASLIPKLDVSLGDSCGPYADVITKAFKVLDEHQWQVEGAPEAKDQLEKFLETVNQAKQQRRDSGKFHTFHPLLLV